VLRNSRKINFVSVFLAVWINWVKFYLADDSLYTSLGFRIVDGGLLLFSTAGLLVALKIYTYHDRKICTSLGCRCRHLYPRQICCRTRRQMVLGGINSKLKPTLRSSVNWKCAIIYRFSFFSFISFSLKTTHNVLVHPPSKMLSGGANDILTSITNFSIVICIYF
jgi:hypothetical protein